MSKKTKVKKSLLNLFQTTVGRWAEKTYKGITNKAICIHLKEEVEELAEKFSPEEAGDCLLILLHFAHKNHFDLLNEAIKKQRVNLTREWEQNEQGVYHHIK